MAASASKSGPLGGGPATARGGCVDAASAGSLVAVRDSKDPDGPRLAFTPEEWTAFTGRVKTGAFDPR